MTWIPSCIPSLRKVVCTPFRNSHFCSYDLYLRHSIQSHWASLESHVTKPARNQVWYKRPPFYKSYLRQYSLCQRSRQTHTRAILFSYMERLLKRRKYLETFLSRYAPLENGQHLSQGSLGETNSDISSLRLPFAHGQVNNPALYKAKIRKTDKTCYKAR